MNIYQMPESSTTYYHLANDILNFLWGLPDITESNIVDLFAIKIKQKQMFLL